MFLGRGTFWCARFNLALCPQEVPGRTFFSSLSKSITFAAAPLVLTPFARNQGAPRPGRLRADPAAAQHHEDNNNDNNNNNNDNNDNDNDNNDDNYNDNNT